MLELHLELLGRPEAELEHLEEQLALKTKLLVKQAGQAVVDGASKAIQSSPRGGVHYTGQPGASSAPGQAPASQSGKLLQSAYSQSLEGGMGVEAGFSETYARYLRDGTKRMQPRPFFDEPADQAVAQFNKGMDALVRSM